MYYINFSIIAILDHVVSNGVRLTIM